MKHRRRDAASPVGYSVVMRTDLAASRRGRALRQKLIGESGAEIFVVVLRGASNSGTLDPGHHEGLAQNALEMSVYDAADGLGLPSGRERIETVTEWAG